MDVDVDEATSTVSTTGDKEESAIDSTETGKNSVEVSTALNSSVGNAVVTEASLTGKKEANIPLSTTSVQSLVSELGNADVETATNADSAVGTSEQSSAISISETDVELSAETNDEETEIGKPTNDSESAVESLLEPGTSESTEPTLEVDFEAGSETPSHLVTTDEANSNADEFNSDGTTLEAETMEGAPDVENEESHAEETATEWKETAAESDVAGETAADSDVTEEIAADGGVVTENPAVESTKSNKIAADIVKETDYGNDVAEEPASDCAPEDEIAVPEETTTLCKETAVEPGVAKESVVDSDVAEGTSAESAVVVEEAALESTAKDEIAVESAVEEEPSVAMETEPSQPEIIDDAVEEVNSKTGSKETNTPAELNPAKNVDAVATTEEKIPLETATAEVQSAVEEASADSSKEENTKKSAVEEPSTEVEEITLEPIKETSKQAGASKELPKIDKKDEKSTTKKATSDVEEISVETDKKATTNGKETTNNGKSKSGKGDSTASKATKKLESGKSSEKTVKRRSFDEKLNSAAKKKRTDSTDSSNSVNKSASGKKTSEEAATVVDLADSNSNSGTTNRTKKKALRRGNKEPSSTSNDQLECLNLHCASGIGLTSAPVFVLTYYGVRYKKHVEQRICNACYSTAENHWVSLSDMLKNNEPLLRAEFPVIKDDVVVMDKTEKIVDEPLLPKEVAQMIEDSFDEILREVALKYNIEQQIAEARYALNTRITNLERSLKEPSDDILRIEEQIARTRREIYDPFQPTITCVDPIDVTEHGIIFEPLLKLNQCPARPEKPRPLTKTVLPPTIIIPEEPTDVVAVGEYALQPVLPVGPINMPPLCLNTPVYIIRSSNFGVWLKGKIVSVDLHPNSSEEIYTVTFDDYKPGYKKKVPGRFLAYTSPSSSSYPLFSRVIVPLQTFRYPKELNYCAGIIAEPQKPLNKYRYLVFLDDGYAQYVKHEHVLPVCKFSEDVIDDIAEGKNKDFMKDYKGKYPERAMVRLQVGQTLRVQFKDSWRWAKVEAVDASLVLVSCNQTKEWLYRGSTRLRPLYDQLLSLHRNIGRTPQRKKNNPYIEYRVEVDETQTQPEEEKPAALSQPGPGRNVAKKSTTAGPQQRQDVAIPKPAIPQRATGRVEFTSDGIVRRMDLHRRCSSKTYVQHVCQPSCVSWTNYKSLKSRHMPPLCIPLMVGFTRLLLRMKTKRVVVYEGPCGRKLRDLADLRAYLTTTRCQMGVDLFDFDHWVRVVDEFHLEPSMYKTFMADISNNVENMSVSCVNELMDAWPPFLTYSAKRLPQKNVTINTDPAFMTCCDCTDDCLNKEKCACWKLTLEGTRDEKGEVDTSAGYSYRRLSEPVTTGIYECHSGCRCSKVTCLNRVVQYPLTQKLQVFRTLRKGWGLRTLNDIPMGAFICIYVGRLLTESAANEGGRVFGDEYLAELDYIEVAEQFKEGYEAEVVESDEDKTGDYVEEEEEEEDEEVEKNGWKKRRGKKKDDDFVPELRYSYQQASGTGRFVSTRAQKAADQPEEIIISDDDEDVNRQTSQFTAAMPTKEVKTDPKPERKTIRELLGDSGDDVYIMDAKYEGNIGRYLNHSCKPNVFVQNVFVDTHDPRFPWIAFFASTHIRAGSELTWDYNYNVGSVPGKVLYCYCNTAQCRGRLL